MRVFHMCFLQYFDIVLLAEPIKQMKDLSIAESINGTSKMKKKGKPNKANNDEANYTSTAKRRRR